MSEGVPGKKTFLLIQWAVVGVVVALIAAFGVASTMGNWELRDILARWTVLSLQTAFILALCLAILAWKDIRTALAAVSRRVWIFLGLLLFAGLILVAFVAPRVNRIYYDEQIYQNIAQNIAWTGKAYLCNEGNAEYGEYKPFATEYNKQPNGHPYYTSLFFRLLGVSERSAHIANYTALLIGALAVFLVVMLLFESSLAALFASAFYIGTPKMLQWSSAAAAEPSTAAFAALAVAAAALFLRARSTPVLLLMATLLAIAIQFRPESVFITIPVALLIVLSAPRELARPRLYWAGLLFVLLALPMGLHMYAVRNESWGSSGERMAVSILWQNLPVNGPFYFLNEQFPLIFSLFALPGLFFVRQWREKAPVLLWFLLLWGIFLFFYAGSYNYGADVRFSLVSAAPLAILAGLGAGWLAARRIRQWPAWTAPALVALVAFMLWIPFLPMIRSVGEEAVDARLDVEYAREMAKLLPVDSIILAHDPSMWLVWGCNAAQLSAATENKGHVDNDFFARYKGGVYMHWGFWCNVPDPGQNQFGYNIKRDYDTELVKAYDRRGFHYGLYRLYPKGTGPQQPAVLSGPASKPPLAKMPKKAPFGPYKAVMPENQPPEMP